MVTPHNAIAGANTGGGASDARELPAMLTRHDVAYLAQVSARTVARWADSDRMPRPTKLGALIRWPRQVILNWIAAGCPTCRGKGEI